MGIPCPILNAGYGQWVLSAFTMHDAFCPPVPPAPALAGLLEGPMPMGNPVGTMSHKIAPTVLVDGSPGVKQGHDVGYMIPHFAIPMNAMCGLNMLLSKHKVMFPLSAIQMKGSPAGTYLAFLFGEICCNPVSLPTGVVLLFKCTVWSAATLIDIVKGLLYIGLDVLFDKLWGKFIKGRLEKLTAKLSQKITQKIVERFRGPICTVLLCAFLRAPNLMNSKGLQTITLHVLPKLGNKVVDHIAKSWVVSPMVTGGARGAPSIGRGDYSHKFFDSKPWW
jgi:hypothetical protein